MVTAVLGEAAAAGDAAAAAAAAAAELTGRFISICPNKKQKRRHLVRRSGCIGYERRGKAAEF